MLCQERRKWKRRAIVRADFASDLLHSNVGTSEKHCHHSEDICSFICVNIVLRILQAQHADTLARSCRGGREPIKMDFPIPSPRPPVNTTSSLVASACQPSSLDTASLCGPRTSSCQRSQWSTCPRSMYVVRPPKVAVLWLSLHPLPDHCLLHPHRLT